MKSNDGMPAADVVGGNGLLHRRALLRRGLAFASAAGIGAGLATSAAAVLALVSSNDVRAQDLPKLLPLDRTLMPDQTAVVMVDFQNNFASPQGAFYSLFEKQFRDSHMIENSLHLVKVARELGIQVIHVTEGYTNDYREVDMGNGATFHRNAVLWQAFKSGSSGAELYEPIRGEKDIVLPDRKTKSAFGGNALDYILKSRGIRNVAVGGFTADVCVYATLLGGYDLGYRMYAMTDAVVSGDAALTNEMVRFLYPYVSRPMPSGEFLAMFSPREGKTAVGK